ncbi:MAG: biotin-dependent carboxyltransferase family protein [Angustibacter sp.]
MPAQRGRALVVTATGPLATVQDLGRAGWAALGVPTSGAADRQAHRLANRLVGNPSAAATIETTMGGLRLVARGTVAVALAGAPGSLRVVDGVLDRDRGFDRDGVLGWDRGLDRDWGPYRAVVVPDGGEIEVGGPTSGVRSYLAVRGGVATVPMLGSRSTDLLSGLGRPLAVGDVLPVGSMADRPAGRSVAADGGDSFGDLPVTDLVPVSAPAVGDVVLRVLLGPRDDWFHPSAVEALACARWSVTGRVSRVGMWLDGPLLRRRADRRGSELASEGTVPGAVQVPPTGLPVVFGADHPVTGGYPVIAVVRDADLDRAAQLRPGQHVHFQC